MGISSDIWFSDSQNTSWALKSYPNRWMLCIVFEMFVFLHVWILIPFAGGAYILSPPVNRTAIEGERIVFTCGADAYPGNITYQWYKDNHNINVLPGYSDRLKINPEGNLIFSSVNKDDMGWYVCRPSNGFGDDPEASAYLNVTCKSWWI